jgi:branched-chain amino acid transport system ATP-binding protein
MLAMSRALGTNPKILLLDELSMGLAPIIVRDLYQIVHQIAGEGIAVLVVEQFARTVLGVSNKAGIMVNGKIVREGDPNELEEELSAAYLGIEGNNGRGDS